MKFNFVIFINESDYFGNKVYTSDLLEVKKIIHDNPKEYLRIQSVKPYKNPFRVLIGPVENEHGMRPIDGFNDLQMLYDIFNSSLYDESRMSTVHSDKNGPGGYYISRWRK